MKYVLNANNNIKVRIKDKGVEHYVIEHNKIMPFEFQISFSQFKERADKDGYHSFQIHSFMDMFGNLGFRLSDFIDLNLIVEKNEIRELI